MGICSYLWCGEAARRWCGEAAGGGVWCEGSAPFPAGCPRPALLTAAAVPLLTVPLLTYYEASRLAVDVISTPLPLAPLALCAQRVPLRAEVVLGQFVQRQLDGAQQRLSEDETVVQAEADRAGGGRHGHGPEGSPHLHAWGRRLGAEVAWP